MSNSTHPSGKGRDRSCLVTRSCLTLCDPMVMRPTRPQSIGFSRQESWSGLPFPSLREGSGEPGNKNFSAQLVFGKGPEVPIKLM